MLDQIAMQLETTCQVVADVARTRPLDITMEVVAIGRVGTAVDQPTCTLLPVPGRGDRPFLVP